MNNRSAKRWLEERGIDPERLICAGPGFIAADLRPDRDEPFIILIRRRPPRKPKGRRWVRVLWVCWWRYCKAARYINAMSEEMEFQRGW